MGDRRRPPPAINRARARGKQQDAVEQGSGQPVPLGRGDRRAATALRRTTNEAFSARYLRACGVPHDGKKRRRIPARYPRACAVGDVAGAACCL